jgi:Ca-activated chloride channel family protein
MWKNVTMKQILLITDGCSNRGSNPIEAAQFARRLGITVNVVGILDGGDLNSAGRQEVQAIAEAGGGISRIVQAKQLAMTMQMVTKQTVQMTIQQVVNKELRQLMGTDADGLPPEKRSEVAEMVDRLGDEAQLQLVLVLDTSASMHDKLPTVREAIRDLKIGLDVRQGRHQVAILTFPGQSGVEVSVVADFTNNANLIDLMNNLRANGGTPTGPAIEKATRMLSQQLLERPANREDDGDGDMAAYVV